MPSVRLYMAEMLWLALFIHIINRTCHRGIRSLNMGHCMLIKALLCSSGFISSSRVSHRNCNTRNNCLSFCFGFSAKQPYFRFQHAELSDTQRHPENHKSGRHVPFDDNNTLLLNKSGGYVPIDGTKDHN